MQGSQADEDGGAADDLRQACSSCFWARAALACVEDTVPRRIAGPMKLVCPYGSIAAAGLVRNRLHGRPLVNRATATNDTRRSSNR
jgi:hypothetical protein